MAHNHEDIRSKRIAGIGLNRVNNTFTGPKMSSWTLNGAFNRCGAEAARVAHNHEVIRSKRIAGIYHTSHRCIKALEHLSNRGGAAEARGADNPEVMGSIPISGIIHWIVYRTFPSIAT